MLLKHTQTLIWLCVLCVFLFFIQRCVPLPAPALHFNFVPQMLPPSNSQQCSETLIRSDTTLHVQISSVFRTYRHHFSSKSRLLPFTSFYLVPLWKWKSLWTALFGLGSCTLYPKPQATTLFLLNICQNKALKFDIIEDVLLWFCQENFINLDHQSNCITSLTKKHMLMLSFNVGWWPQYEVHCSWCDRGQLWDR